MTGSKSRIINKGVVPDSCTSFQARLDTEMSNYNASFIQRQFLYDPELAKFLYNDMNAFDYDIDDKKMALAFFMDVLARSYHTTILAQFVECLVRHLRSDEQLSSWVLKQFCNTSAQDWGGSWLDGLVGLHAFVRNWHAAAHALGHRPGGVWRLPVPGTQRGPSVQPG